MVKDYKITRIKNSVSASQATTKCSIIDMAGFDEVTFLVALGAVTNTGKVTVQVAQGDANSSGGMEVSTATSGVITSDGTTIALSNKIIALTVNKPLKRYLELQVITATANGVIDSVVAIQGQARTKPVTQDLGAAEFFLSPGAAS